MSLNADFFKNSDNSVLPKPEAKYHTTNNMSNIRKLTGIHDITISKETRNI